MLRRLLFALCLIATIASCAPPTATSVGQRAIATPVPPPVLPTTNVSALELNDAFDALLGPTNDLVSSVQAVAPFPELAGTDDAVVVVAQIVIGSDSLAETDAGQFVSIVYETGQDHRGAMDFNWTALRAFGIPALETGERDNSSGKVTVAPVDGDFTSISAETFTRSSTGRTAVGIIASVRGDSSAQLERFADWHDNDLPLMPETGVAYVDLLAARNPGATLNSFYETAWETFGSPTEVSDALVAIFDEQGWDYAQRPGGWRSTEPIKAEFVTDGAFFTFGRDFSEEAE